MWVPQDLAQQSVVLSQHTTRDGQVAFEGRTRCLQLLHGGGEKRRSQQRAWKGSKPWFGRALRTNIRTHSVPKTPIKIKEKEPPHVIAFGDDDGILPTQIVEARKGGAEHRVGRDKSADRTAHSIC